jgi:hypothetical protein
MNQIIRELKRQAAGEKLAPEQLKGLIRAGYVYRNGDEHLLTDKGRDALAQFGVQAGGHISGGASKSLGPSAAGGAAASHQPASREPRNLRAPCGSCCPAWSAAKGPKQRELADMLDLRPITLTRFPRPVERLADIVPGWDILLAQERIGVDLAMQSLFGCGSPEMGGYPSSH